MPVRALRPEYATRWPAIALAIAAWISQPAHADGPKGADWASKDAAIYVEATHPEFLLDRLLDPKLQAKLHAIPRYEKFLKGDQFHQLQNGATFVSNLLDTTWDKGLRKLAGGGIVLVVEAEPGKPPWGFIAITPTDPAFLAKAEAQIVGIARADAQGKGQPDPFKETVHRGVTFYASKDIAYGIVQDTLVIAQSADALKLVVDRSKDGKGSSITSNPDWKARHDRVKGDTLAWGFVRLDRLRQIDAKKFTIPETTNPGPTFLLGSWIDVLRKAPWAATKLTWTDSHLTADVTLPTPPGGLSEPFKKFLPPKGVGAAAPLRPRGVIASLTLWRDVSAIWEVRNDLFTPEFVQGLAQLDTFAGQYFGGRDFGSGVLGAIGPEWRIVVAEQDYTKIKPVPDLKLPAVALVIDVRPEDEEFAQRLKVAFQSFVGLANLGTAQSKSPPLELGSEAVDGVTIATTKFMLPKGSADSKEPVHQRQNYSPSVAQVDNHFIISSSLGLIKDLIPVLRTQDMRQRLPTVDATVLIEADGTAVARVLDVNRQRLVTQNMLEKGNDKATASGEIDLLLGLLRYAGHGTLSAKDSDKAVEFRLDFALGAK
jgi:hypothetical protein